jgi:hypothetical protein
LASRRKITRRAPAGPGRQRGRLGADLHADERDRVVAVEGQAAGDDLVEQHAGGVEVGAGVDLQAEGLLGAHVLRGAEHHAGAGHLLERTVAADDLGDAEVDQLEHLAALVVAGDEDVLRLEVAVDHALAVGVLEAAEHLQDEADRRARAAWVRRGRSAARCPRAAASPGTSCPRRWSRTR